MRKAGAAGRVAARTTASASAHDLGAARSTCFLGPRSRHHFGGGDMGGRKRGRDMGSEVATWFWCAGDKD